MARFPMRRMRKQSSKKKSYSRYTRRKMRSGYNRTGGLYRLGGRSNTEYKFFDTILAPASIPASGEILDSINLVPQSTSAFGRIGREVSVKSVDVVVTLDASKDSKKDNFVRVMLYLDKQANGAAATVEQVLNLSNASIPPLLAYPNLENSQRFIILKDALFSVPLRGISKATIVRDMEDAITGFNVTDVIPGATIRRMRKRLNLPITFNDGAVSLTSVKSNNLGMLFVATNGGAETTQVGVTTRIRYSDK